MPALKAIMVVTVSAEPRLQRPRRKNYARMVFETMLVRPTAKIPAQRRGVGLWLLWEADVARTRSLRRQKLECHHAFRHLQNPAPVKNRRATVALIRHHYFDDSFQHSSVSNPVQE